MEIICNRYKIEPIKLGSGGFSDVFLGIDLKNDQYVAVKKISLNEEKTRTIRNLHIEISVMKELSHENIIHYLDDQKNKNCWYIVMEYCNAGTIENVIQFNKVMEHTENFQFNREQNTYYYLSQLKDALFYIRKNSYVHRDIKPQNVLLKNNQTYQPNVSQTNFNHTEKLILKLADFGLSKSYDKSDSEKEPLMESMVGSPMYMSPEIILSKKYEPNIDIWSYGLIMFELLFGYHPNKSDTFHELIQKHKTKKIIIPHEQKLTDHCMDLLTNLLAMNPLERISWQSFFDHPWFKYWDNIMEQLVISDNKTSSRPIKINSTRQRLVDDYNISPTVASPRSQSVSPLGYSNLTRMKMNFSIPKSKIDYSASYPDKIILPKSINDDSSQAITFPPNNSSLSSSRIFKTFDFTE